MQPVAAIIGHTGQDGRYLYELLVRKGYYVIGVSRSDSRGSRAPHSFNKFDVRDINELRIFLTQTHPDEIYYLAAHHHSAENKPEEIYELFEKSFEVHVTSLLVILESMTSLLASSRLFYAASSHVFGNPSEFPQSEITPLRPSGPYAISKATGVQLCQYFRKEHGVFASCGYLYNHESPYRSPQFLTKKIVMSAVAIKKRKLKKLKLGNLGSVVDWGYAPDYVKAMNLILKQQEPDDFIVASGKGHTVKDFVEIVFDILDLDWKKYVIVDETLINKTQSQIPLIGDAEKLRQVTGWVARHTLKDIARIMTLAELGKFIYK